MGEKEREKYEKKEYNNNESCINRLNEKIEGEHRRKQFRKRKEKHTKPLSSIFLKIYNEQIFRYISRII